MDSSDGEAGQIVCRSWSMLLANDGQLVGNTHVFNNRIRSRLRAIYP